MPKSGDSHFSPGVITTGEKFQQIAHRNRAGRAIVRAFSGSSSPAYRGAIWRSSPNQPAPPAAHFDGDPNAGPWPRLWRMAAIIAAPTAELEALKDRKLSYPAKPPAEEAIAYTADGVLHVGTKATQGFLFENLDGERSAVAMRLGKGPLEATMGVWLPDERTFIGVSNPQAEKSRIPVSALVHEYPGVVLV